MRSVKRQMILYIRRRGTGRLGRASILHESITLAADVKSPTGEYLSACIADQRPGHGALVCAPDEDGVVVDASVDWNPPVPFIAEAYLASHFGSNTDLQRIGDRSGQWHRGIDRELSIADGKVCSQSRIGALETVVAKQLTMDAPVARMIDVLKSGVSTEKQQDRPIPSYFEHEAPHLVGRGIAWLLRHGQCDPQRLFDQAGHRKTSQKAERRSRHD